MPKDIENCIHRIGRTGRCNEKGLATILISEECSLSSLLDLKGLLHETGQRIPPKLQYLKTHHDSCAEESQSVTKQCGFVYCGGLGHRIGDCPKLQTENKNEYNKNLSRSLIGIGSDM